MPQPVYPAIARQMRLVGAVTLSLQVRPDGKVSAVEIVDGHPFLATAAKDAAKNWRFKPATVRGEPVSSTAIITVNFGKAQQ